MLSWPGRWPPEAFRALAAILGGYPKYPGHVRLTEFWRRMRAQFGDVYAESVAKDFVLANLGGRTVDRALAEGIDAKVVWRSVCDQFNLPESVR